MPVLACIAWSRSVVLQGLISPPVWITATCGRSRSSSSSPKAYRKLRVVVRTTPSRMISDRNLLADKSDTSCNIAQPEKALSVGSEDDLTEGLPRIELAVCGDDLGHWQDGVDDRRYSPRLDMLEERIGLA